MRSDSGALLPEGMELDHRVLVWRRARGDVVAPARGDDHAPLLEEGEGDGGLRPGDVGGVPEVFEVERARGLGHRMGDRLEGVLRAPVLVRLALHRDDAPDQRPGRVDREGLRALVRGRLVAGRDRVLQRVPLLHHRRCVSEAFQVFRQIAPLCTSMKPRRQFTGIAGWQLLVTRFLREFDHCGGSDTTIEMFVNENLGQLAEIKRLYQISTGWDRIHTCHSKLFSRHSRDKWRGMC